jgi:hypothetical protein
MKRPDFGGVLKTGKWSFFRYQGSVDYNRSLNFRLNFRLRQWPPLASTNGALIEVHSFFKLNLVCSVIDVYQ